MSSKKKYQGMRWFKCDLHMHSPLAANWQDDDTKLKIEDSVERKKEVAQLYLKQCHKIGLEVIAITDHNFALKPENSFIIFLQSENNFVAKQENKNPIIIFPGFEIEAHVGKGNHVVCLFEPNSNLQIVNDKVTTIGLPSDKRFDNGKPLPSTKSLSEILKIIQKDSKVPGLVIAAHSLSNKGIFDNDRISEWWQVEEFKNPDLLCVEVSKPIEEMNEKWQYFLKNDDKCLQNRKRNRAIACIMSSDAYNLTGNDSNFIGSRSSWIKMSKPSIESLRQAFLDNESRICLQNNVPAKQHPWINSIKIKDTDFLEDSEILFSENFNCIIGGRGTGKSTILEYIRMALRQDKNKEAENKTNRIKNTLNVYSNIQLKWLKPPNNLEDVFEYNKTIPNARIINREVDDPSVIFNNLDVQIFSQEQISNISKLDENNQPAFLLKMIYNRA